MVRASFDMTTINKLFKTIYPNQLIYAIGRVKMRQKIYHMEPSVNKMRIMLANYTTCSSTFSTTVAYYMATSFQWSSDQVSGPHSMHKHVPESYKKDSDDMGFRYNTHVEAEELFKKSIWPKLGPMVV